MRIVGALLVVGVVACGGGDQVSVDAGVDAATVDAATVDATIAETCADLQQRYRDVVLQLDDACTTPADCTLVGGVESCDCEVYLGPSCWGYPVSDAALSAAQAMLGPIANEFHARCDGIDPFELDSVCDCEPWATPTCENNHCGYHVGPWCIGEPCDPVEQTGCGTGDKCTWIQVDAANGVGDVGCVADGSVAVGQPCTYGPDGATTGYDDCAAGAICIDAVCQPTCDTAPDSCTPPATCVIYPGTFPDDSGYGACAAP